MKRSYPWLALGLGLLLSLILMRFSANGMEGRFQLPLLTSLLIAEFGFLVPAIAAGIFDVELIPWYGSAAIPTYLDVHRLIEKQSP